MTAAETIRQVIASLDAVGIPFMLTGSFASSFHGVPRATQDIDLVVDPTPTQLRAFVRRFASPEYYADEAAALEALATEGQFNILALRSGWKVDLIMRKSRPFSRVEFERRQPAIVEGISLAVVSLEDIILAKLEWAKWGASERQLDDVAALLRLRGPELDETYLQKWRESLALDAQWRSALARAGDPERKS